MSVNPGERKAALSEKRRNLLLVVFESIVGIFLARLLYFPYIPVRMRVPD